MREEDAWTLPTQKRRSILEENNGVLKIAVHNINGLKSRSYRLDLVLVWAAQEGFDLVGLTETNIQERTGKFLMKDKDNYRGIWACADVNKSKGSGVGLLISKRIEKYIGKVEKINEFLLIVNFYLPNNITLSVMVTYLPPSNSEVVKEISAKIRNKITFYERTNLVILMGDFNHIVDPQLDQARPSSTQKNLLLHW